MTIEERVIDALSPYLGSITVKSIWKRSLIWASVDPTGLRPGDGVRLVRAMERGLRVYLHDPLQQQECTARLEAVLDDEVEALEDPVSRLAIQIQDESDIVLARGTAATVCRRLGFPKTVEIKVATAVSELSRNIVQYGGGGEVTIIPLKGEATGIEIIAVDFGSGIPNLDDILEGNYTSRHGMGMGLRGTKRLMDYFEIETAPGKGTTITVRKYLTPWN